MSTTKCMYGFNSVRFTIDTYRLASLFALLQAYMNATLYTVLQTRTEVPSNMPILLQIQPPLCTCV
jgi:hypothetical protein